MARVYLVALVRALLGSMVKVLPLPLMVVGMMVPVGVSSSIHIDPGLTSSLKVRVMVLLMGTLTALLVGSMAETTGLVTSGVVT